MAISTFAAYKVRLNAPWQRTQGAKTSGTNVTGRAMNQWQLAAGAGAAPTTAAVPTNATAGALGQFDSSGVMRIGGARMWSMLTGTTLIVADRLSHQGGLSGTVATAQTTNLPTAALTRYTNGEGVFASVDIYTAIGATATTGTISYTNTAGTTGRTSQQFVIGGANFNNLNRSLIVPLANGDTGVKAVASLTNAASTLTAGAFGITLWKPLYMMGAPLLQDGMYVYDVLSSGCQMPQVQAGACLYVLALYGGSNSSYVHDLLLIEE